MFIAQQLKQRNIAEYLLYMWQTEDLIRAFDLDLEKINQQIVEPYQLSAADKKKLLEWYESLVDMMRSENVRKQGHIWLNKNTMRELDDFHAAMIKSGKEASYNAAFYRILPALNQLRQKQTDPDISDMELCISFLYGILMLKLQKKEITPETREAQAEVIAFLALLNTCFQRHRTGELLFED